MARLLVSESVLNIPVQLDRDDFKWLRRGHGKGLHRIPVKGCNDDPIHEVFPTSPTTCVLWHSFSTALELKINLISISVHHPTIYQSFPYNWFKKPHTIAQSFFCKLEERKMASSSLHSLTLLRFKCQSLLILY